MIGFPHFNWHGTAALTEQAPHLLGTQRPAHGRHRVHPVPSHQERWSPKRLIGMKENGR